MRRALKRYLPPEIAKRKGKGNPAQAILRAATREWPKIRALLEDPIVCARGYVNRNALKSQLEQPDFERNLNALSLIRLSCLELWLDDLETRQSAQVSPGTAAVDVSSSVTNNGRASVAQVYP
jgi:hypothetical protein